MYLLFTGDSSSCTEEGAWHVLCYTCNVGMARHLVGLHLVGRLFVIPSPKEGFPEE